MVGCPLGRLAGGRAVCLDGWRSSPLLACRQTVCLDGWLVVGVVCLGGRGDADAVCLDSLLVVGLACGQAVRLDGWLPCASLW